MSFKNMTKQVLLVDDDEEVFFVIHECLKNSCNDFEIITASNGLEALEKIGAQYFDLLITDIRMPSMNGIQLTKAIKKISPNTQVIWMTAYDDETTINEAEKMGVKHFLSKPFDIAEIREIACSVLRSITEAHEEKERRLTQNNNDILEIINRLKNDVRALSVILLTTSGNMISSAGFAKELDIGAFSALIQGNIQVANEISKKLGDSNAFKLSYLENGQHSINVYRVNQDYVLVVVFGSKISKGLVWYYTEKTAKELNNILNNMESRNENKMMNSTVFNNDLTEELGDILDGFWESTND